MKDYKDYLMTQELQPGMQVMHASWDPRTSNPMLVKKVKKKIMLWDPRENSLTEPTAGGESDYGWYIVS